MNATVIVDTLFGLGAVAALEIVQQDHRIALVQSATIRNPSKPIAHVSAYALLGRREEARAALQLWKPTTSQRELSNIPSIYQFRFHWSQTGEGPSRACANYTGCDKLL